jgi:2,3-bisphosphoglycerate-independent phosphoglycerate mutase
MAIQKTILVITDGIGCKPDSICNAFKDATKPNYDYLMTNVPKTLISTHGLSVGLPVGQMGNSEVGHMTIGSGRVLYQDLVKISLALKDRSIEENDAFNDTISKSDTLHLIGLLSDGGVHSHIEHIIGMAEIAEAKGKRVYLHLITDGRDVSPTSSKKYIEQIEKICSDNISIATISGRFYTMDRDNRWERVESGYGAIAKANPSTDMTPEEYIDSSYREDITDEFIKPVAFGGYGGLKDGDSWCLCAPRWQEAFEAGAAPKVRLAATHIATLEWATLSDLQAHSDDDDLSS